MSAGLQLRQDSAVPEMRLMTVAHLADLANDGRIRTNPWQRPPRWNDDDRREWALRVCQGKADVLALHQTAGDAAGGEVYFAVDGQNRIETLRLLLADSVLLPTADLLRNPGLVAASVLTLSGLRALSPEAATNVETRQLYVLVYPPHTTQHQLRRVFYDNNQGKHMTSHELIYSWNFLPLVRDIVVPANERFKAAFAKLSGRWRARQCGLVHTLVRIVATVANQQLHLGAALAVESWAARFQLDVAAVNPVVVRALEDTLAVLYCWRTRRDMCGLHAVPDVAWFVWRLRHTHPTLMDIIGGNQAENGAGDGAATAASAQGVAMMLRDALAEAQGDGKTLFDNFWRRPALTLEHVEIRRRQLAAAAVAGGLWPCEPDVVCRSWMEPTADDEDGGGSGNNDAGAAAADATEDDDDDDEGADNAFNALARLWRPPSPS